jgi:hypothetical protein
MECEVLVLTKKINLKSFTKSMQAFHLIKVEILND